MHVFLFDYEIEGHHCTYLYLFAKAVKELGYEVTIISPADITMLFENRSEAVEGVKVVQLTSSPPRPAKFNFFSTRRYITSLWQYTSNELRKNNVNILQDLVFFTSLDEYQTAYISMSSINKIFPYKWSGLYLKPRYIRVKQRYSIFRKSIFNINYLLQSKNCCGFGVLDDMIADELSNRSKKKPVYFLPDIIDESILVTDFELANQIKKKAAGRKIVLLIGALDHRKNLVNFIKASESSDKGRYFFVAAGQIAVRSFDPVDNSFISEFNKREVDNFLFYNQRIETEAQFNAIITLCDILFAAYIDFPYSSNMLGKSAFYRKPIIVSRGYLMEDVVNEFSLGIAIEGSSPSAIIEAIDILVADNIGDKIKFHEYFSKYSWKVFKRNLDKLLKISQKRLLATS